MPNTNNTALPSNWIDYKFFIWNFGKQKSDISKILYQIPREFDNYPFHVFILKIMLVFTIKVLYIFGLSSGTKKSLNTVTMVGQTFYICATIQKKQRRICGHFTIKVYCCFKFLILENANFSLPNNEVAIFWCISKVVIIEIQISNLSK